MDLIVLSILMRALFGKDLPALRDEIEPQVVRTAAFFLAAARHGGVDWHYVGQTFVFYQRQLFSIAFVWRRA